jgi:hypothetical protein
MRTTDYVSVLSNYLASSWMRYNSSLKASLCSIFVENRSVLQASISINTIEWVGVEAELLVRIREVLSSNLGLDTSSLDWGSSMFFLSSYRKSTESASLGHYQFLLNSLSFFIHLSSYYDRFCGLVVRVLGYRSGGPGTIPGSTRKKIMGLERGPLSLVSITEELLDRKVAALA